MIADILQAIVVNALTVVFTNFCFMLIYTVYYSMQHSKLMKDIRRYIAPANRVIACAELPTKFKVATKTSFHSLLNEAEQRQILEQDAKGRKLFNGRVVRLDAIEDSTAILSEVKFFDFMTTNLVIKPNNRAKKSALASLYAACFSDHVKQVMKLEHRVKAAIMGQPRKTFDNVIAIKELANIVTVSVLIRDCTGRALLVHRGNKVAISSGSFATSCAGSVDVQDLETANPFLSCAQRELKEELNLVCSLHFDSLVISKQKLQPAALFSGCIDCHFEDVYQQMISAPDYREETCALFAVPADCLKSIVKKYQFTDVAAFQLASNAVNWACVLPRSIEKFILS